MADTNDNVVTLPPPVGPKYPQVNELRILLADRLLDHHKDEHGRLVLPVVPDRRGAPRVPLPKDDIRKILYGEARPSCEVCRWTLPAGAPAGDFAGLHLHHVIPVRWGGGDGFMNLLAVCPNHHTLAHAMQRSFRKPEEARVFFSDIARVELAERLHAIEDDPGGWKLAFVARLEQVRRWLEMPHVLVERNDLQALDGRRPWIPMDLPWDPDKVQGAIKGAR